MKRVCMLGGESSGKTLLAERLAAALGTVWVPEYGRQRWEELRRTLTTRELVEVAQRQVEMEDAAADSAPAGAGWIVCDTSPLTTLQYCVADHGSAPAELYARAARRYDAVVVCAPDFPFVQDGARRDAGWRDEQHRWTLQQLQQRGWPYAIAAGSPDERVAQLLPLLAPGR